MPWHQGANRSHNLPCPVGNRFPRIGAVVTCAIYVRVCIFTPLHCLAQWAPPLSHDTMPTPIAAGKHAFSVPGARLPPSGPHPRRPSWHAAASLLFGIYASCPRYPAGGEGLRVQGWRARLAYHRACVSSR